MLNSDEMPGYLLFSARSAEEVQFGVDLYFPWHTHLAFVVRLSEIPNNDYDAQQGFLQIIEAELGSTSQPNEYVTLARLADDMVQLASPMRS